MKTSLLLSTVGVAAAASLTALAPAAQAAGIDARPTAAQTSAVAAKAAKADCVIFNETRKVFTASCRRSAPGTYYRSIIHCANGWHVGPWRKETAALKNRSTAKCAGHTATDWGFQFT
ncbi:hypothetical protein GCM10011575_21500 [Microlunatus endophyticus]|uniref:Alpha amylase inhibitor n=1 Tax=Microlunatus endophyticus TaxID=1716077 RepID=A0A917S8F2_9ACTN|nr:hypothetical protein [Microlunatus endophyticus]GGL62680.1 hypothetical protein GCM10011575_21500 [Microlunatus endophyticus]